MNYENEFTKLENYLTENNNSNKRGICLAPKNTSSLFKQLKDYSNNDLLLIIVEDKPYSEGSFMTIGRRLAADYIIVPDISKILKESSCRKIIVDDLVDVATHGIKVIIYNENLSSEASSLVELLREKSYKKDIDESIDSIIAFG